MASKMKSSLHLAISRRARGVRELQELVAEESAQNRHEERERLESLVRQKEKESRQRMEAAEKAAIFMSNKRASLLEALSGEIHGALGKPSPNPYSKSNPERNWLSRLPNAAGRGRTALASACQRRLF